MYATVIFFGINNCSSVVPFVATERTVLYRERFAGMYSSWAYSSAQVPNTLQTYYQGYITLHIQWLRGFNIAGASWSAIPVHSSSYICHHHISYDGLLLVSVQDILVILWHVLFTVMLHLPGNAAGVFDTKHSIGFYLDFICLHNAESLLWLHHTKTSKLIKLWCYYDCFLE